MTTAQKPAVIRALVPLLFVADITECVAFYIDNLGFTMDQKWEPDGLLAWCMLRRDGSALMLQQAGKEDGPADERGLGIIFYFNCADVDALYAEVVARGLSVNPPEVVYYGQKQLSVTDPGGYVLCFQSSVEGA